MLQKCSAESTYDAYESSKWRMPTQCGRPARARAAIVLLPTRGSDFLRVTARSGSAVGEERTVLQHKYWNAAPKKTVI
jgi:hypothetical protein